MRDEMLTVPIRLTVSKRTYSAMIDSGSYHSHLDLGLAYRLGLPTRPLPKPVTILGFNGKPAGTTHHTLPWDFGIGHHHFTADGMEWLVSRLKGDQKIILGYDFLKTFNPLIDWEAGTLAFKDDIAHLDFSLIEPGVDHHDTVPTEDIETEDETEGYKPNDTQILLLKAKRDGAPPTPPASDSGYSDNESEGLELS
ncbi:hypothetical protein RQP46_002042 [Phenoliferia psychrophenolica]